MGMDFMGKLPIPMEIKAQFPLSEEAAEKKAVIDKQVKAIFEGKDDRILLVIGPCSADREDAVLAYIEKLREVQDKVADKLLIVPRIYTNKPRTTGEGYKGMLHYPDPNEKPNIIKGVIAIRKL
ncbi:MAG: 3-deoxy-7-phosphoheptulonate synthase, partial [Clostridia bacterium]|nr:3-deoxy-7-phosphoheptulonate synthase [Clostridia bacterium]